MYLQHTSVVLCRVAAHGMAASVHGVEAGVGIPGLVKMDAIDTLVQQAMHSLGVVAQAVVRAVGHHSVHRSLLCLVLRLH